MDAGARRAQSLQIEAQFAQLRQMSAWVQASAKALEIPQSAADDLEVCANEVAANIISYGYAGEPAAGKPRLIDLTLAVSDGHASLTLVDDALPFNPLDAPERPNPASLEDAPIGGLGIRLIRGLCTECRYSRANGRNHLEMRIALHTDQAPEAHPRGVDRRLSTVVAGPDHRERRGSGDRREHAGLFRASFFRGIPWHAVEEAIRSCPERQLAKGEVLLESGQINEEVFVLIEGRLLVRLPDSEAADAILIEPGGSIGELSIIDNKPVSARVEAADSCTLAVISARVFWDVLMPVSGFARNVMRQLSERMRSSNEIIVERMRERIALEQLQKEIAVARDIQSSMLPPRGAVLVEGGRAAVYGLMDPARDIGGDFYDAFMTGERHLLMVVGDVSGKGVPAALFMARAVAVLRAEALRARARPAALLERVNTLLCANNETGMFVTLLAASLDLETGELQYANAGHLAPVLRRADGAASWLPLPDGALVGVMEGAKYGSKVLHLNPGDTVLLYTDGVTEAMDSSSALFGDDRLLRALSEAPGHDVAQMTEHVRISIAGFVNAAATADDITMLAVRRN